MLELPKEDYIEEIVLKNTGTFLCMYGAERMKILDR